MIGTKFLLDTNFVIGLLKENLQIASRLQDQEIVIGECAYSFITRIELLGYPTITGSEIQSINHVLSAMQHLPMTQSIEDATIEIRRQCRLKTPDAIIPATAKVMALKLLTLDQQLANRMVEILE